MVSEEEVIKQYNEALCKFPKLERPTRVNQDWEIIIPHHFPLSLFQLHEVGGKIPKQIDWHNSLYCCVSTNARIYHVLGEECTLLNWLDKFAHPYLANHIVRKITKEYASGEFAHGAAGIVQDYEMLFKVKGEHAVCKKLKAICILTKCSRNEACFCGSGINNGVLSIIESSTIPPTQECIHFNILFFKLSNNIHQFFINFLEGWNNFILEIISLKFMKFSQFCITNPYSRKTIFYTHYKLNSLF